MRFIVELPDELFHAASTPARRLQQTASLLPGGCGRDGPRRRSRARSGARGTLATVDSAGCRLDLARGPRPSQQEQDAEASDDSRHGHGRGGGQLLLRGIAAGRVVARDRRAGRRPAVRRSAPAPTCARSRRSCPRSGGSSDVAAIPFPAPIDGRRRARPTDRRPPRPHRSTARRRRAARHPRLGGRHGRRRDRPARPQDHQRRARARCAPRSARSRRTRTSRR